MADVPSSPTLAAGPVILRELAIDDVDDIVEACQEEQTWTWTTVPHPYEREHAISYVTRTAGTSIDSEWPRWAIEVDGRWSGNIGLRMDGLGLADVGYLVAPWARRRGVGSIAAWLACDWAFRDGECSVVTWHALAGNEPSRRLVERVGFRVMPGVARRRMSHRGVRIDVWMADLLPDDLVPLDTLLS